MANVTASHPRGLFHDANLFSASELFSQNTAYVVLAILSISLLWQGFQRRKFYRGLPGPPHSLLFGHLPIIIEATQKFPADGHPAMSFTYLMNKYNLWRHGLVYIDTYPLANDNILIATTPEAAAEITERNFVHHPFMTNFYGRIVGLKSMTLAEGQQWKDMRKTFNPGFSLTNIMTLMPEIVKQGEILSAKLSQISRDGGFAESLDELARGVTLDIIFRVVLGLETNTQRDPRGNEVGNLLESMSQWMGNPQSMNPLKKVNFPRWFMLRWNERKIKKILSAAILKRWELVKENQAGMRTGGKGSKELKLVIDLALKHYCEENVGNEGKLSTLSDEYLDTLSDNIQAFIFGGHDTTASSIAYTLYELSRNPEILEMVRQEHTDVFGPDLDTVATTLLEKPHLVNQLPITIAAVKETLRLYPPAGALRLAEPGSTLTLNNNTYPLTSQLLWVAHPVLFRSPLEFPNPHLFLPQRFLPADFEIPSSSYPPAASPPAPPQPPNGSPPAQKNHHAQTINPDAYRPFERGPRNCIGQELAMLELKVVLVLLARKFSFREGYDELAARRQRRRGTRRSSSSGIRAPGGWFGLGGRSAAALGGAGLMKVDGVADGKERRGENEDGEGGRWGKEGYLVGLASSKTKAGVPVWVSEASGSGSGSASGGSGAKEVKDWGGKAYYISLASNKPKEGIPVWVSGVGSA